ncbi:redoxin domain-containing protein [Bacillus sp. NTK071]|nr:redoxin domain-containing protein [Bacillus sp. NTK071]
MESEHKGPCNLPNCAQTTDKAPSFRAQAFDPKDKEIKEVSLEDYRGKWVILFFYSSDFTFV